MGPEDGVEVRPEPEPEADLRVQSPFEVKMGPEDGVEVEPEVDLRVRAPFEVEMVQDDFFLLAMADNFLLFEC